MVTPYVARLMVVVAVVPAFLLAPACQRIQTNEQSPAKGTAPAPPATSQVSSQDDGQWLMAAKNYAKPAWTFSTGGLIAGVLGATGVAAIASQIAWILFIVGVILLVIHLATGRRGRVV